MSSRIVSIISLLLCIFLVIFYRPAMAAARNGFELWATSVMPALFPFMVCTAIIQRLGCFCQFRSRRSKSRFLQSFARVLPLFSMCCISGAPSGARLSALYFGEACHDRSASTALCASCNMVSPMFIAGTLCASMLDSADLILPICIAHYISAFVLLILTLLRHTDAVLSASASIAQKHDAKPSIPSLISQSIFESFSAVIGICGAIVFFMVLASLLSSSGIFDSVSCSAFGRSAADFMRMFTAGVLEMTNGCSLIKVLRISPALSAAFAAATISFGGICIFMQSLSFIKLSPKKYFGMKALQAVIAFASAYFLTPLFISGNITAMAGTKSELVLQNVVSSGVMFVASVLAVTVTALLTVAISRRSSQA